MRMCSHYRFIRYDGSNATGLCDFKRSENEEIFHKIKKSFEFYHSNHHCIFNDECPFAPFGDFENCDLYNQ